jgi:hypothetical protein
MAKQIAWTTFITGRNDYGQVTETIKPGDSVTQDALGVDDEEYAELLDVGAIREEAYPKNIPNDMSPVEFYAMQDGQLERGELSDKEAESVMKRQAKQLEGVPDEETPVEEAKKSEVVSS